MDTLEKQQLELKLGRHAYVMLNDWPIELFCNSQFLLTFWPLITITHCACKVRLDSANEFTESLVLLSQTHHPGSNTLSDFGLLCSFLVHSVLSLKIITTPWLP